MLVTGSGRYGSAADGARAAYASISSRASRKRAIVTDGASNIGAGVVFVTIATAADAGVFFTLRVAIVTVKIIALGVAITTGG
jgi:hypothetical protein